jgi:type I restriction enzyme S subunit
VQLSLGDVRALEVPVVAKEAQITVSRELRERTIAIDKLIARTGVSIELARERRSALITAAVTGQLNVSTGRVA